MENIHRLLEFETAGDPMTGLRWTQKTTKKIADELLLIGIRVCPNTVAKLLKQLGYSLRTNQKSVSHGKVWTQSPVKVNDHDFRSQSYGMAVPYGIYDTQANHGTVFVGTSSDTPDFSTDCLSEWYEHVGQHRYPHSNELLILADSGGSNGSRSRVWKHRLQEKVADRFDLTVTVCHYPPGCSKWNPIEHRLFSEISKNWSGIPLVSYERVLNYISTTATTTGLEVQAYFFLEEYQKGARVSSEDMASINMT